MEKKNYRTKRILIATAVIIILVIVDQVLKIHVKTTMVCGETIKVTDWLYLGCTENPYMMNRIIKLDPITRDILRISAVLFVCWFLWQLIKRECSVRLVVFISLVVVGGIGNAVDDLFYSYIFTESSLYDVAKISVGNGPLLYGKVVDMLNIQNVAILELLPLDFPMLGSNNYFNIADVLLSVGSLSALFCNSKELDVLCKQVFKKKAKIDEDMEREHKGQSDVESEVSPERQ